MLKIINGIIYAETYSEEGFKKLDALYERVPNSWTWKSNGKPLDGKLAQYFTMSSNIKMLENGIIYLIKEDPALEEQLDKLFPRVPGLKQWQTPKKSIFELASSFIGAITSGFADGETIEKRKQSCFSCPMLITKGQAKYCGGCNCGIWPVAKLDGTLFPKLGWKYLTCPLRRPGFSNFDGR